MPVVELPISRSGDSRQKQRTYRATGYATEAMAISATNTYAPSSIGDLDLIADDTSAEETDIEENWIVRVTWRLVEPSSGLNYAFDIGGGSFHRSHSIATVSVNVNGGDTAPEFNGAINYDGETVAGADLPQQTNFVFTIPARKPIADVDNAYVQAVASLLYKTNDATFEGFAIGEIVFLGLSGSRIGEEDWQLYYRFAREENVTGLTIDTITDIDKEGWEYLWVYFEPLVDDTAKVLTAKPKAVFVEQVFEEGDFSDLEL